jgi:O-antigen biosynthesis protein
VPLSLSIVIPTYQRIDLLTACLESIELHAPPNTEVIVVDDAAPGGGPERLAAEFRGVRCLRLTRRSGFAAAANAGLRSARSDIVEFLNDDTEVTAGWAEAALASFADPKIGAVAPLVLFHPATQPSHKRHVHRLDSAGDRYYRGGVAAKRGHGQALSEEHVKPRLVFGASASSAFYRRVVLQETGGFPESFGAYFEDVDVAFRLHWDGWQTLFEPKSRVFHHVSSSYGKKNRKLLEVQSRNEERVFWRNIPRRSLAHSLPRHVAVLAAKALLRWSEGGLLPFILGRLRLLTEVAEVRRHRRQLHMQHPHADWTSWQVESSYWRT